MQLEQISKIRSISDLPKIASLLLPEGYELLPNASELFELEFALYECNFLLKAKSFKEEHFSKVWTERPPSIMSSVLTIVPLSGRGGQK